ncbi:MAG: amidase [Chloroflexi bacterium]|nr:amidase [Chloroflexota bacterium]
MTMTTPLHYESIENLSRILRRREIGAVEIVEHFLRRTDALNNLLHAVITVAYDHARAAAAEADRSMAAGSADGKPLLGIPITVKDVMATKGIRTTANSRTLGDWVPDAEPLALARLREAGAIVLAKANCNEYFGIPSEDDRYPRPRTPFNTDYVAIGSSSGSGVAVAAGIGAASIGTDSAGSVRLPAAQAGAFGMKSTNGHVSLEGHTAYSNFQVIGPLARTTADAALLTSVMAGEAPPTISTAGPRGLRIGVPWRYIDTSPAEPEIRSAFRSLIETLEAAGAQVVEVSIPGMAESRMATFVAMYAEHHASKAVTLQRQFNDLGRSARLYAMQGAFISAVDYLHMLELGRQVRRNVDLALGTVDVIAMPTSPYVTAEAARRPSEHRRGMNTVFTVPFNLTGHPAITVPCGFSELGIPIGAQFAAAHGAEDTLYRVSLAVEQLTDWHLRHPPL